MKLTVHTTLAVVILCVFAAAAHSEVQIKSVEYKDGEVVLKGYFAWDDALTGRRPGVIVVHEWWGLNDYAKKRAKMLAELGYVAFAADMYGDGKVTKHAKQAKQWKSQIASNIASWQKRALLGLDILRKHEFVDPTRMAAVGYCFGGATVMQLAYSGADLSGVVSFHGSLPIPSKEQALNTKASILIEHGYEDKFVSTDHIAKFMAAVSETGIDWQMTYHSDARHGFTNPDANSFGIEGLQYNERADRRSWENMQVFFREIFGVTDAPGIALKQ